MKVVIRLDKEQSKHISRLADAAGCSESEIVVGFIDMDRAEATLMAKLRKLLDEPGSTPWSTFKEERGLGEKKRGPGRERAFTPAQEERVIELRQALGWNARQIAEDMVGNGVKCSRGSVLRVLRRAGL